MTVFDVPQSASVQVYRDAKLEILRRDFKINLTDEEEYRAKKLETETQVDQFFLGAINKHL